MGDGFYRQTLGPRVRGDGRGWARLDRALEKSCPIFNVAANEKGGPRDPPFLERMFVAAYDLRKRESAQKKAGATSATITTLAAS